jgi:hypothetical protein
MLQHCVSTCVTFGVLLSGCQLSTDERVLLRYEPPGAMETRKAPYAGTYRLYATRNRHPTITSATSVLDAHLRKGELIGFARDRAGGLFAVVRGEQRRLSDFSSSAANDGAFVWTMQPDPGQIDQMRTALLVGTIVVVAGVAIGVAVAAAGSSGGGSTVVFPPF